MTVEQGQFRLGDGIVANPVEKGYELRVFLPIDLGQFDARQMHLSECMGIKEEWGRVEGLQ